MGNLLPILSADVIARYHRLKGDEVLFVSGSDEHGTPTEVEAIRQGITPKELTDRNHEIVSRAFEKWEISFDNYTRTENPVHKAFVRDFFLKIERNRYLFTQENELLYCPNDQRFLPDRFVEGKCPHCDYDKARGDQCEQCGRLLDPTDLVEPYCAICGTKPTVRKVTHWYFDMPKFTKQLLEYIENNKQLPDNTRNFSLNLLKEGLKPRPVTRDNRWGIPAPFKGADDKTLYVWVDAVLGYVSATIEYFQKQGNAEKWRTYWFNKNTKTLFFIGKDNIIFHTLILPALLLATHEGYNLPWTVSTNEWLIFEGQKSSKSRRIGIWIDESLAMFPADYWRYALISIRPETRDADFTWKTFVEKVNSDLNDTIGNFIHRTLKFINSYFSGEIPKPGELKDLDLRTLQSVGQAIKKVENALEAIQLQAAIREVTELSRVGNIYLSDKEPWITSKTDLQTTANTLYVAAQIVKALAILLGPFTPKASEAVLQFLDLHSEISWNDVSMPLPVGHKIKEAEPLFSKIELSEKGLQEMLEKNRSGPSKVSYEEFSKMDLRIGRIAKVETIPKSSSLIKLTIDIGDNQLRTAVAGISKYYSPTELEGKNIVIIANLQPRKIFGVESEVMILAAQDDKSVVLLQPEKHMKAGSKIS